MLYKYICLLESVATRQKEVCREFEYRYRYPLETVCCTTGRTIATRGANTGTWPRRRSTGKRIDQTTSLWEANRLDQFDVILGVTFSLVHLLPPQRRPPLPPPMMPRLLQQILPPIGINVSPLFTITIHLLAQLHHHQHQQLWRHDCSSISISSSGRGKGGRGSREQAVVVADDDFCIIIIGRSIVCGHGGRRQDVSSSSMEWTLRPDPRRASSIMLDRNPSALYSNSLPTTSAATVTRNHWCHVFLPPTCS